MHNNITPPFLRSYLKEKTGKDAWFKPHGKNIFSAANCLLHFSNVNTLYGNTRSCAASLSKYCTQVTLITWTDCLEHRYHLPGPRIQRPRGNTGVSRLLQQWRTTATCGQQQALATCCRPSEVSVSYYYGDNKATWRIRYSPIFPISVLYLHDLGWGFSLQINKHPSDLMYVGHGHHVLI